MSKTRFVAFATQKGGIGKSTIFPSDPNLLRGSGIKELSDEICEIIKT